MKKNIFTLIELAGVASPVYAQADFRDDPACRNSSAMGTPGIGKDGNGAIERFTERKVI